MTHRERASALAQKYFSLANPALNPSGPDWKPPFELSGLVAAAFADVERETIRQDAKWMQHKAECKAQLIEAYGPELAQRTGFPIAKGMTLLHPVCICGLADRLKESQP